MSWNLGGDTILTPNEKTEKNDIQMVIHKGLDGSVSRDFIGTNKKIYETTYKNIPKDQFDIIWNHYVNQRDSNTTKNLTIDDLGFNANVLIIPSDLNYNVNNRYDYMDTKVTYMEV